MGYGDVDSPFVVEPTKVHEVPKPQPKPVFAPITRRNYPSIEYHQIEEVVKAMDWPITQPNSHFEKGKVTVDEVLRKNRETIRTHGLNARACKNCGAIVYRHLTHCACGFPTDRTFSW